MAPSWLSSPTNHLFRLINSYSHFKDVTMNIHLKDYTKMWLYLDGNLASVMTPPNSNHHRFNILENMRVRLFDDVESDTTLRG